MTEPTDAELEAMAEKLCRALGTLVDQDIAYDGRNLVIPCDNHGDALHRVFEARSILAMARVALQPEENGDEVRG